ncbi:hypothetical protein F4778DRAFT_131154 [Xylariomycetidae sp. FL2044]|nr:hypothetical protein F4778DRAFT_131154 [Xylariomycetidae sp. FL2044]
MSTRGSDGRPILASHHSAASPSHGVKEEDLDLRITKARSSLASQLSGWDVPETTHVGFEVILPTVLTLLERADAEAVFEFEAWKGLRSIRALKLVKLELELLCGSKKTPVTHSPLLTRGGPPPLNFLR